MMTIVMKDFEVSQLCYLFIFFNLSVYVHWASRLIDDRYFYFLDAITRKKETQYHHYGFRQDEIFAENIDDITLS